MGLCFSKKQQEKPPGPPPSVSETSTRSKKPSKIAVVVADERAKKTPQPKRAAAKAEEPAADDKKAVFVVKTKSTASGEEKEEARAAAVTTVPVRTSSCTKEEVDAILIQCGRLSRSSSGRAASSDTGGGGHRRHPRSKRSYDFDQERKAGGGGADEEGDWERQGVPVSRPSPQRRSPQRKRSGSRERSGGGSRRASRSPGRRAEGVSSASSGGGGERARQQPGKMVSVPAREKGRAPSPAAASGKRCASPRSSSPARVAAAAEGNENARGGQTTAGQTPSLSRSSSRKAEQSPYRRSPMAEIDENPLRNNNSSNNAKPQKKLTENAVVTTPQKSTERAKEQAAASCRSGKEKPDVVEDTTVAASETRTHSSKTTATRTVSIAVESLNPRSGCRPRRASRDFDQNPNSYATQLLEDIQNHHQQNTSAAATAATLPSFSLPTCVSKACSILEAVDNLNSTSSEYRSNDKVSVNASLGRDDLADPSMHKYVPVRDIRGKTEPQESAGSNSVSGHPWTPSWEPNSVESTDRTWSSSRSNNGDEVVEQGSHGARSPLNNLPQQSKQRPAQPESSGRSRGAGSGSNNVHRGRSAHRGSGSVASGRSGVRAVSASS